MPLPERLRWAREQTGLTQAEASLRSGIGESSISEFEGGRRAGTPRVTEFYTP